ncbi:MAG: trehalase family glycosidase [Armatimonadota bacterium]
MILPCIWGDGGALFAFSGMDGPTDALNPLVGSTIGDGRGFRFHSPGQPTLCFGVILEGQAHLGTQETPFTAVCDRLIAGSAVISEISVDQQKCLVEFVFAHKDTVLARVTSQSPASPVTVFMQSAISDCASSIESGRLIQRVSGASYALITRGEHVWFDEHAGRACAKLEHTGDTAVFVWGHIPSDTEVHTEKDFDVEQHLQRQLKFFADLPDVESAGEHAAHTFAKCASVLKVNCCTAQGNIPFDWTTPDRWPHQWMWIWDSAFHAIGLRHFSSPWAEDAIKAVLALQRANGFIPHMLTVDGRNDSEIIQPPILAWASLKVHDITGNREFLEYIYPRIARMLEYDTVERDQDGDGLSEWETGCASGMDNSPRFDEPVTGAVDLNSYIVNDMKCMAQIASRLGREDEALKWQQDAARLADRINSVMWDEQTQFYYDIGANGQQTRVKTVASFMPLFAGICSQSQAEGLVGHLTNPNEFWRGFPISSVSADEPSFCDNMWRGATWVNFSYFLIESLPHYGYDTLSEELRRLTLGEISRWCETDGLIYEYYDSEGVTDPVFLHRKALGGPKAKKATAVLGTTICDYGWTAALFIDMLLAECGHSVSNAKNNSNDLGGQELK